MRGYTAPEYAIRGELSEKADIYSFGVLVLEIISSRKNTNLSLPSEMQYLPEYAWRLYERSKVVDLVDPKLLADGIVESDVLKTCHVAFLCLQPLPSVRPPMSEVVAMLIHKSKGMQSPMRPAFLDRKNRINRILSWESASGLHPSPIWDSNSFPPPTDKSQESSSEVLPPLLRKFTTFPKSAEKARVSGSELLPSQLCSNSPAFSSPGEESRENVSEFLSSLMQFSASSPPPEKAQESVSELHPSPIRSDSPSFPPPAVKFSSSE